MIMAALAIFSIEQGAPGAPHQRYLDGVLVDSRNTGDRGLWRRIPRDRTRQGYCRGCHDYGVGLFGVITGALATWVIEK